MLPQLPSHTCMNVRDANSELQLYLKSGGPCVKYLFVLVLGCFTMPITRTMIPFGDFTVLCCHISQYHRKEWNKFKYTKDSQVKGGRSDGNFTLPPIPNGVIISSIWLACALCYFAVGSTYDIAPLFGIAYGDVISSEWIIVHAINICYEFQMSYP